MTTPAQRGGCRADQAPRRAKSQAQAGQSGRDPNRRGFLITAATATAATLAAPAIVRGRNLNERLQIAIIGAGGRGRANLSAVQDEQITALCDVNRKTLEQTGGRFPEARRVEDFRDLFGHDDEFDAVVVSTCEHTHAFATLPALQLGKHVYCEKPLTYNVWEARMIREAAERAGVATQMGTQIHAGENYRRVVELVESGAIGPVREAHVWVSRAWGWQPNAEAAKANGDIVFTNARPTEVDPVPPDLNWDLWLGPAPWRPFSNIYVPGPKWYRWWDFGNGTMSDLGSHWNDLPFWALGLDAPLSVEASGPPPHPEIAPASMQATYQYGPRGDRPAVTLSWYQGSEKPRLWREKKIPQWGNGVLFIGDEGMLLADYGKHVLLPETKFQNYQRPEPYLPPSRGHHAEWLHACKTGAPTTCNFTYAGKLTEANHLGNVAYRVGKKIEWDSTEMRCPNTPEAAPLLKRTYREGWTLAKKGTGVFFASGGKKDPRPLFLC